MKELCGELATYGRYLALSIREKQKKYPVSPYPRVAIARLNGNSDEKQTKYVISAFRGVDEIEVLYVPRILAINIIGLQHEQQRAAQKRGKEWLRSRNADVLIWGEVSERDKTLSLSFTDIDGG